VPTPFPLSTIGDKDSITKDISHHRVETRTLDIVLEIGLLDMLEPFRLADIDQPESGHCDTPSWTELQVPRHPQFERTGKIPNYIGYLSRLPNQHLVFGGRYHRPSYVFFFFGMSVPDRDCGIKKEESLLSIVFLAVQ